MTYHRTTRARSVVAATAALAATAAGTLALGTLTSPADAAAARDSVIASVKGLPAGAEPGDAFTLKVATANPSRTTSRPTNLVARLSRDARPSADDTVLGSAVAPALRKGARGTTRLKASVPDGLTGRYTLLVCTAKACTAGGTLRFAPPVEDLDARLTGDLTFTDTGDDSEGSDHTHTWDHTQAVHVDLAMAGEDFVSAEIVSSASTWDYSGSVHKRDVSPPCVHTYDETRAGGGTIGWTGDVNTDDIWGGIGQVDATEMSLGMRTGYTATARDVSGGREGCAWDETTTRGASNLTSLDLVEVARTATSRTYEVESWTDEWNTVSDWDDVEGTLVLTF